MRIRQKGLALVLTVVLSTGIIAAPVWADGNGKALLWEVNREHSAIHKPSVDFTTILPTDRKEIVADFALEEYAGDVQNYDGDTILTYGQVVEDMEVLFSALKATYGPYEYFGGDSAFLAAKAAVLADCVQSNPLNSRLVTQSLQKHLSFVADGHFTINGQAAGQPVVPYLYTQVAYTKANDGFHRLDDDRLVMWVEGCDNLWQLFARSFSDSGEIVYYPRVLAPLGEDWTEYPEDLVVHYADGSSDIVTTKAYQSCYDKSERVVDLHYNQGIPVIFARNMYFDEATGDEWGRKFLDYAEAVKNEPVVIMDLRSNGGGNSLLPAKWLEIYCGKILPSNHIGLKYWTEADLLAYDADKDNPYYASYDTFMRYEPMTAYNAQYSQTGLLNDAFVPNDQLLVILTGKNTASAAEIFVDLAHNLGNTLIVGENTYGVGISNAYTTIVLPNSNIAVQLGTDLTLYPDGYFPEFVGIKPDIWTDGDAEELAVKWIKTQF